MKTAGICPSVPVMKVLLITTLLTICGCKDSTITPEDPLKLVQEVEKVEQQIAAQESDEKKSKDLAMKLELKEISRDLGTIIERLEDQKLHNPDIEVTLSEFDLEALQNIKQRLDKIRSKLKDSPKAKVRSF